MKYFIRFLMRNIPRRVLIMFSGIFSLVISPFLTGKNVKCPVCESKFSKFLPYGINMRKSVLCPKCLSLERHRLLWLYLKNESVLFKSQIKVLHIAPEQCFVNRFRAMKNLNYVTGDLESPLADILFDIQKIPLDDSVFDVVICSHVLEHIENDIIAMKEILRILTPGGWALLQVPIDHSREITFEDSSIKKPKDREKYFGQKDHLRVYGNDYSERLRSAGFIVKEINYLEKIPINDRLYFRLPEKEMIYLACKSK